VVNQKSFFTTFEGITALLHAPFTNNGIQKTFEWKMRNFKFDQKAKVKFIRLIFYVCANAWIN
jgi:hypothetical protein